MDRPVTATAFAVHEIKRLIVERELPPGERIDQADLARRLNLSRLPIRQALAHLGGQGFVHLRDHRSAIVSPVSERDMRDLYSLRCRLEEWGFSENFSSYQAADRAAVEKNLELTRKYANENDHPSFLSVNRDFHFYLYSFIQNPYLKESVTKLFDLSERYHWMCTSAPEMMLSSYNEHVQIFNAIKSGDLNKFISLSEAHNLKTIKWVHEHGLIDLPA